MLLLKCEFSKVNTGYVNNIKQHKMDKIALCLAHLYQYHICTPHVATSHRHIAPILVHCPLAGRPRTYDSKHSIHQSLCLH